MLTLLFQHKNCRIQLSDQANNIENLIEERDELNRHVQLLTDSLQAQNSPYPLSNEDMLKLMLKNSPERPISATENHRASQTVETAFVPCESCHAVQVQYRKIGDDIINVCNAQKLTSALKNFKPLMAEVDWMTGSDVIRWSKELEKDVLTLKEHLTAFDEVRAKLSDEKKRCKELRGKVAEREAEIKKEKDTQAIQMQHFDKKMKTIQAQNAEVVKGIEKEKNAVVEKRNQLEEQLGTFKEQLKKQEGILDELGKCMRHRLGKAD